MTKHSPKYLKKLERKQRFYSKLNKPQEAKPPINLTGPAGACFTNGKLRRYAAFVRDEVVNAMKIPACIIVISKEEKPLD